MNETEQIFLLNPSGSQNPSANQKIIGAPVQQQDVGDFSTVCRTCATVTEFVIPIFEGEGLQNNLAEKIHKHLPIQVCEADVLPRVVCYQCASTLLAWHELVQCCVQADAALRTRLAVAPPSPTEPEPITKEVIQNTEEEPPHKDECLLTKLKDILNSCFPSISVTDDDLDLELVCQKCEARPAASSVQQLADHLELMHVDITDAVVIKKFVKNYVTLEETLASEDSDRDENFEPTSVQPKNLPKLFCPFCTSIFSTASRLMSHLNQHLNISLEIGVECCNETFKCQKMFVDHLQNHHVHRSSEEAEHSCRTCGHKADNLTDLQSHIAETHLENSYSGEPAAKKRKEPSCKNQKFIPAVCPECNKVFSNIYNMFVHMKSHLLVEAKFVCDVCKMTFRSKGNLNSHKKVKHEGVLKHVCTSCGEAFPTKQARDVHERLHSGQLPYACDRCPKAFRASNTLQRHIETHLNIRKHVCHLCPKKFRKSTHLKYHLSTHKEK